MDKGEARQYLSSLLNKNLRVTVTDGRMFLGAFKCTDALENVVLANSYEYRQPDEQSIKAAAASLGKDSVKLDMTSRYLGLIVLPGHHIVKMEVEEFASQLKGRSALAKKSEEATDSA